MLFLFKRITLQFFTDHLLVLNLGHSPLYRHFYKCLYIEFDTFHRHDIAKASFALLIWLDGNAIKNFTCLLTITYIFFARQSESKLSLFSLIEKVSYFFSPWQSSSKLALLITYRKSFKSSLLYIIQCLKFSSEDTFF